VGKDAVLKFLPSGDPVVNFTMARDLGYMGKDGEWIEKTQWLQCAVYGKATDRAKKIKKGHLVVGEGQLTPRLYTNDEGEKAISNDFKFDSFRSWEVVRGKKDDGDEEIEDVEF
jgi:single-strand DNA-binding protein